MSLSPTDHTGADRTSSAAVPIAPCTGALARAAAVCALAAALAPPATAEARDLVGVFRTACLETMPNFRGADEIFAEAGYGPARELSGQRRFGTIGEGDAAVQIDGPARVGTVSSCMVSRGSGDVALSGPGFYAIHEAVSGLAPAPPETSCEAAGDGERCLWIWTESGECHAVIGAARSGLLESLFVGRFASGRSCAELLE